MFDGLIGTVEQILAFLARPLVRWLMAVSMPASFLLGAIANPGGFFNWFLTRASLFLVSLLPSTPENLKFANLILGLGQTFPLVGASIIQDLFELGAGMLLIVCIIKIWKLLPFT